ADAVAVDAPTNHVFVANGDGASVSILDAGSGRVLHTVTVGLAPGAVAVDTATRRVFVASRGGITVSMLDAVSGRVLRTVPLGTPSQSPVALAVDPTAGCVVVGTGGENGAGPLSVLDARTGAVLAAARGTAEILLAVNPRSGRVFSLNVRTNALTVRATRTGAAMRTIPWMGSAPALDWLHSADIDAQTGHVF